MKKKGAAKKKVAPGPPMRQLSRMRRLCILGFLGSLGFLAIGLSGCSLPAPYQTYAPDQAPAPTPPPSALTIYGATTTTPDMVLNAPEVAPVPPPPPPTAAPTSNRVAICYNRLWNRAESIKDAAVQACGGGTAAPQITSQGVDIDACPLLTPTKATFSCSAPKAP